MDFHVQNILAVRCLLLAWHAMRIKASQRLRGSIRSIPLGRALWPYSVPILMKPRLQMLRKRRSTSCSLKGIAYNGTSKNRITGFSDVPGTRSTRRRNASALTAKQVVMVRRSFCKVVPNHFFTIFVEDWIKISSMMPRAYKLGNAVRFPTLSCCYPMRSLEFKSRSCTRRSHQINKSSIGTPL